MGKLKIHKGCGGSIKNDACTRCGKKFGRLGRMFSIEEREEPFDERAYKRRIREGKDIFR